MSNDEKPFNIGDKVRWKQMPAAIATVTKIAGFGQYFIKFETDGPLKGQVVPVTRAALWGVTVLDELAIECTDTPDPFFRKRKDPVSDFEAEAKRVADERRRS